MGFVSKMNKSLSKVYSKFRKIGQIIADNFAEFCRKTVLHGFNFIGNQSLSIWERLFFLISLVVILVYVTYLTTDIYDKWDHTPIIVGLSPHPILINKLPFPTVTICNVNQLLASKVRHFSRTSIEYSMVQTLCTRSVDNVNSSELRDIKNRTLFQKFIQENAQPCDKLLLSCKFGKTVRKCNEIFKPVLTDEGQCCIFNSVHSYFIYRHHTQFADNYPNNRTVGVNWDPEDGYQKPLPNSFYPRIGKGIGISLGLSIVIDADVDDYYCSSTNGHGFKLLLHNPIEIPTLRENGLFLKVGAETSFRIAADRSEASTDIRGFSINERQCVFKSERQLKYFKTYSRRNCEIECLGNMTEKLCGCVSYILPKSWATVPACSLKDIKCEQSIRHWTPEVAKRIGGQSCKIQCMQACFDLSFTPARFSIPLTSGGYMIENQMLETFNSSYLKKNIAVVHFYYKLSHFDGFMRTRYVGITEFISNTGGLIGLLGFSFIGVAEIVYFLLIKPLRLLRNFMSNLFEKIKNRKMKLMQQDGIKEVRGAKILAAKGIARVDTLNRILYR